MELMDWKHIETTSEQQIIQAEQSIVIAKILLKEAITRVKALNGSTNAEIAAVAKEKRG